MASEPKAQIKILLSSRQLDIQLPEDPGPILVSTDFKRITLSELVNNLLQTEKRIPLDFLINGQLLRTSIDDFLTANGISSETTLEVEYVRALIPPLHVSSFEQDDWISSVDVLSRSAPVAKRAKTEVPERVLSGGYDGLFRMWDTSGGLIGTSPSTEDGGHTLAVKAVRFISPNQIASSGLDRTIRIWDWNEDDSSPIKPKLTLYGHRSSVVSIAVNTSSSRLLSGSNDLKVGYWSMKKSEGPEAPSNLVQNTSSKRRKLSGPSRTCPARGPLSLLSGHKAPVSGAAFTPNDHTVAYSTSWDHTLKTWDLTTETCVDTRTTSAALLALAPMPATKLVATGSASRNVVLVDPRASATSVAAMTLRGHRNVVSSVAPDPESAWGLVSGSHDGSCRIWDIRNVRAAGGDVGAGAGGQTGEAVYTIARKSLTEKGRSKAPAAGDGVKVFSVVWDKDVGIVSGGEDKRVQINRRDDGVPSGG